MMMKELLLAYQKERGISLRQLAREAGVQYQALRRFTMDESLSLEHWAELTKWVLAGEAPKPDVPRGTNL